MSSDSENNFPYEIKELSAEKNKEIWDNLRGILKFEFVKIGPKGYFLTKDYTPSSIYNFPVKSSDIFVASYPKSGTTWTQELVWLLGNNLDFEKAKSTSLTERFPFLELSMISFLDNPLHPMTTERISQLPDPRFIKTHLPMTLLPPKLLNTTKVVYVARDPRDVVVSFFHHKKLMRIMAEDAELKPYWNYFIKNEVLWTPYFDHVLEAWEKRNHPNMLFLFYEELSKDLPASIRRVAKFLGKKLTDEQVAELNEHLKFDNFKKNKSVNLEELQEKGVFKKGPGFLRKGKVGGWRDDFDEEMTEQAEKWIADNLRDTDLRFPHF